MSGLLLGWLPVGQPVDGFIPFTPSFHSIHHVVSRAYTQSHTQRFKQTHTMACGHGLAKPRHDRVLREILSQHVRVCKQYFDCSRLTSLGPVITCDKSAHLLELFRFWL
ncbi:unnamed protein product [Protopolystoma xenopodis]|uniref:Uncharacterized protein n=1 Tax=Protopolystoma xenopodis TaxID=117903 RepID=A0A3S5FEI3_9PLAT|nr:unnamed protein product [Protopolystoma xenopodis]